MNEEKDGFSVIDRRSSSGATDDTTAPKGGPGFTMKESESDPATADRIDFSTLIFSLATGAFIHLGLTADPATQKVEKNIPMAKQNIDILEILQKKTKGNLNTEESSLLDNLLGELHLRFVEAIK